MVLVFEIFLELELQFVIFELFFVGDLIFFIEFDMEVLLEVMDDVGIFDILGNVEGGDLIELLVEFNELLGEYNGVRLFQFNFFDRFFFNGKFLLFCMDLKDLEFVFVLLVCIRNVIQMQVSLFFCKVGVLFFLEVEVDILFDCQLELEFLRNFVVLFGEEGVEKFVVQ